ncbi:Flp family type IVb pilin [Undibacterium sp. Rencai35W]|uniref:Flp family type IVb pilin n=1 Tax=Undibacterium sp. Rencai35W TaxID=3413046 RepID=UPI003BF382A1
MVGKENKFSILKNVFHRNERGQAMIEYIVVTGVMVLVMFTPHAITNNLSPAEYIAQAVRSFFRGYSFLVSVF